MKARRPVNLEQLPASSIQLIRARVGGGAVIWRYVLLLPLDETKPGENTQPIATPDDLSVVESCLAEHFHGVTVLPAVAGFGLRDGKVEGNTNVPYVVFAAPTAESEHYFQTLKRELQDALVQETILIERQETWVL